MSKKSKNKKKIKTYIGTYISNKKGFGFIKNDEFDRDIFIANTKNNTALDGDIVEFIIEIDNTNKLDKKSEGIITKIIERKNKKIVGIYQKSKNFGFLIPDNKNISRDIFIPKKFENGAKDRDKIVVEVYDFGSENKKPQAKVIEILGSYKDKGVDILSIAKAYDFNIDFSKKIKKELTNINQKVSLDELKYRKDYRDILTITIDGEDAKDLDDAISLSYDGKIWTLYVHIADVSHYVKEASQLDKEAIKRGTSIYLVDRVIPMLPKELSNGICSLTAKKDRLCLSCIMNIDQAGNLISHEICESVINVDYRLSYKEVYNILKNDNKELKLKYKECIELFYNMENLSSIIRKNREKRGAIDFDFPETKVILDNDGKVIDLRPYDRNVATKIIEDFMIFTNETIASEYFFKELPFVYRVHEKPDPDKMQALSIFINNFGFTLKNKKGQIYPKDLQNLLNKLEGSPKQSMISAIILRNMKKARYQTDCIGHFGLASKCYTHFTSPIRRYPDLQIHRIIKENINQSLNEKRIEHYEKILEDIAFTSSEKEKQAEEAERESIKYKKCEYMLKFIGEEFEGVISGVTKYGFYVELDNTVEGLVHIAGLSNDYYNYVEDEYKIIGNMTKISYSIGERVLISVENVDKMSKTIDFKLLKKCIKG